jgi:hypothetical protein
LEAKGISTVCKPWSKATKEEAEIVCRIAKSRETRITDRRGELDRAGAQGSHVAKGLMKFHRGV